MSDTEARLLGAGDGLEVRLVTGVSKKYTLRPVSAMNLCELEREALKAYKTQYLEGVSIAAKFMPDGQGPSYYLKKAEEAARWSLDDIPKTESFFTSQVPLTPELKEWLAQNNGLVSDDPDIVARYLLNESLEAKQISPEKVKELSGGVSPRKALIRYDMWYVSGHSEGRMSFIYWALKGAHPDITREEVGNWPLKKTYEAVQVIESLSKANMGNT